jgi:hypothetical protein
MSDNGWDGENERRQIPPPHVIYKFVAEQIQAQADSRFRVRTLSDLQALLSLAVVLVGGIVWGTRLEQGLEKIREEQKSLQTVMARGILPLAEERLASLTARLDRREQEANQALEMIREVEKECRQAMKK